MNRQRQHPSSSFSRLRLMQLEPRILFDAALAVEATVASGPAGAADAATTAESPSHDGTDLFHLPVTTTPERETSAAALPAPVAISVTEVSVEQAATAPLSETVPAVQQDLQAAAVTAHDAIVEFLSTADSSDLFALFNGQQETPSSQWLEAAENLQAAVLAGEYQVHLEILSNTELQGAMAAFSASGTEGTAVIYLNADWLGMQPDTDTLARVLVEEIGHSFDAVLNGPSDTLGDEGDGFAIAVLGGNEFDLQRLSVDDHATLAIDGLQVEVEESSVTFSAIYEGTPSAWSLQASSLTLTDQIDAVAGTIKFISADPAALYFDGNNIAGTLIYVDSDGDLHTMDGVISRQFKSGGTTNAFYFYETGADGLVNGADDATYLLQLPTDSTSYTADGSADALVRTSSDPVDTALNSVRDNSTAPALPALSPATSYSTGATAALEEGTSGGHDATGNVLDSSLAANFASGLRVLSVGTSDPASQIEVAVGTTAADGTLIQGVYGALTLGADGTYVYVVDNSNPSVDSLLSTSCLSETFTYTVGDSSGSLATTTLSVTIEGQNDAPVGVDDYNTTQIGGETVSGNILANDTDVDWYGETLQTLGVTAAATASNIVNTEGGTVLTFSNSSGWPSVKDGFYAYYWDGSLFHLVYDASGQTVTILDTTQNSLSATPTQYSTTSGLVALGSLSNVTLGFDSSANDPTTTANLKTVVIASSASTASATLDVSNITGSIVTGMTASGSGTDIPDGTTITSVTYDENGTAVSVTLNKTISTAENGSITFSAAGGATLTGTSGTLVLDADGAGGYTYTPFATGTGGSDVFTYTVMDAGGATSTATLNIQVLPASTTLTTVAESGAITVGTPSVSGSVIEHDTVTNGTETVINGVTGDEPLGTSQIISDDGAIDIDGRYGTLHLSATGEYIYTLKTDATTASTLDALADGDTLTESFQYLATNGTDQSAALLTITINGINDAPTLALSTSGSGSTDFVGSFTQGGVAVSLATLTGIHIADIDSTSFSAISLSFSQENFSDGADEQLLISDPTGTTTIDNLGGLSDGDSGSFTLGDISYTFSVTVDAGVATLLFTPESGITLAESETLVTALRYQNLSSDPTEGSDRVFTLVVYDNGDEHQTPSGILASNEATATITVYNTNTAPLATPDTVTATEAGGTDNGTAGVDPTGNVLTGETSNNTGTNIGDSGYDLTLTQAIHGPTLDELAAAVSADSTSSDGARIAGSYGWLTIGADGSYLYTVDNSNAAVNALQSGSQLTDVFTYQITDNLGATASSTLTVTIAGSNDAPTVVSAPADQNAIVDTLFSYQIPAFTDIDSNDTITYSVSGTLPEGISFDPATRTLSGTATVAQATTTITVRGTDSQGAFSETSFTIAVSEGDTVAPAFTSATTGTADENQESLYLASTEDTIAYTDQVVSYSLKDGGDADFLSIDAATGLVSLKTGSLDYETKGSYTFTVVAEDETGNAREQAVTINVNDLDEIAPDKPVITGISTTVSGTERPGTEITVVITDNESNILFSETTTTATDENDEGTGEVAWAVDVPSSVLQKASEITTTAEYEDKNFIDLEDYTTTINDVVRAKLVADHLTNDATPVVSGTAEAGSTVTVFIKNDGEDAIALGTTTVDKEGNWSLTVAADTLKDGKSYQIVAIAGDEAGNTSQDSESYSLTIDTSAPTALTVTPTTVEIGSKATISGTFDLEDCAGGFTVEVKDLGKDGTTSYILETDSELTAEDPTWSLDITVDRSVTEGEYKVIATAIDGAGNVSSIESTCIKVITPAESDQDITDQDITSAVFTTENPLANTSIPSTGSTSLVDSSALPSASQGLFVLNTLEEIRESTLDAVENTGERSVTIFKGDRVIKVTISAGEFVLPESIANSFERTSFSDQLDDANLQTSPWGHVIDLDSKGLDEATRTLTGD